MLDWLTMYTAMRGPKKDAGMSTTSRVQKEKMTIILGKAISAVVVLPFCFFSNK